MIITHIVLMKLLTGASESDAVAVLPFKGFVANLGRMMRPVLFLFGL